MTFDREAGEAESYAMLDRYVAAGGNFIDTANVYSAGKSEEVAGRWLHKQRRESFVIATKVRFPMGQGPDDVCLSRKHIYAAVKESLTRLGTDYIDLYQRAIILP
jgi:aryl-alcohol dehydrogenase-like predicted oxidoreductase